MQSYRSLYFRLYAAMSAAVEAIEDRQPEAARQLLLEAMQDGEAAHMAADVPPDRR